jgi:hypothetical protein
MKIQIDNIKIIKNKYINKYLFVLLLIILFILIFYLFITEYLKNKSEYFNNLNTPTYLFFYGNINSDAQKELRKLYKDEYKESVMSIKVFEKDIQNEKEKINDFLQKYFLPPKFEYEVRYYPKGLNDNKNFESYYGKISDLKDNIIQKENKYNDLVSEEEDLSAEKQMKSLM